MKKENVAKTHYQRLRLLGCEELWSIEVPIFDRAESRERMDQVGVIRAVGVVFSESGTPEQKELARHWLRGLLQDPQEKIRRYAMTALPKIGANEREESELLALWERASSARERKSLGNTLEKVGGRATLHATRVGSLGSSVSQKVQANVTRIDDPGSLRFGAKLESVAGLRVHLRCRTGLEEILKAEFAACPRALAKFHLLHSAKGSVTLEPAGSFCLEDIYELRCFATVSFMTADVANGEAGVLAAAIAGASTHRVLQAFTEGPIRYRLDFVSKGHQRKAVRQVADQVFVLNPALLNDPRKALWQINIQHMSRGCSVEVTPKLRPDPRFAYRQGDVPAASHPPLAACMARLAGSEGNETVWDPFCGSGLELIERTLLGGVVRIFGTDRSEEAISVATKNLGAALGSSFQPTLIWGDFRDRFAELGQGTCSLVITNPPMGRRVPIPDLAGLIRDLFAAAGAVLRPGGRLVLVNPLPMRPPGHLLRPEYRREIDLGGFHCHLEKYVRA